MIRGARGLGTGQPVRARETATGHPVRTRETNDN